MNVTDGLDDGNAGDTLSRGRRDVVAIKTSVPGSQDSVCEKALRA
jgi:hypothetical protein